MSIAIATRGIIAGVGAATGTCTLDFGAPDLESFYDESSAPLVVLPVLDPTDEYMPFKTVSGYLPDTPSTEEVLPSKNRTSYPLPRNLE